MTMDNKKLAAATAAVFTYIKTQEEAAYFASANYAQEEVVQEASGQMNTDSCPNVWGSTGRSSQMQLRSMIQMRVF